MFILFYNNSYETTKNGDNRMDNSVTLYCGNEKWKATLQMMNSKTWVILGAITTMTHVAVSAILPSHTWFSCLRPGSNIVAVISHLTIMLYMLHT